jgi:hypothetical protein
MKYEVTIPKKLKIGGFDYSIEMNDRYNQELRSNHNQGECSHTIKRITIISELSPQQMNETFLHELVHAVDGVYCNYKLTEDEVAQLGNGFLQIFEQMGIRFVRSIK